MKIADQIRQDIQHEISEFISIKLGIMNREFNMIIYNMYINNDISNIKSLIEPEFFQELDEKIQPLIKELKEAVKNKKDSSLHLLKEDNGLVNISTKMSSFNQNDQKNTELKNRECLNSLNGSNDPTISFYNYDIDENVVDNNEEYFENIPDGLIPEQKEKEEKIKLKSFIYKIEHEDLCNKEEKVEDKINEIREALRNHNVVIVQGDTGCGKTTRIPRLLLSDYRKIVCTQPRRIAAISVAKKVAEDMKCALGGLVGYSVRFDSKSTKATRLKFVTDGILLQELSNQKSSIKYDLIIIDEAHERSINVDFLMGYLKSQDNIKLLIMSATIDNEKFIEYFNCPSITINHRSFPIEYFYLKKPVKNYFKKTVETAIKIIKKYDKGDILVFLTGYEEIDHAFNVIDEYVQANKYNIKVLKLHSSVSPEEQALIFQKFDRKIILSTNIAETSVTIENILFVVDSGKVKQKRRATDTSIDFLEVVDISQAQAKQRAGRTGRTAPGIVYRIYTYNQYVLLNENTVAEILRSNLSNTILSLKNLNINDVINFDYIEQPPIESLKAGLKFLYYLKAIDGSGKITPLGKKLASFPIEPEIGMSLLAASKLGCLEEVAIIASFLSSPPIFVELHSNDKKDSNPRQKWSHPKGDFYMYLQIFKKWKEAKYSVSFLKKNFLNIKVMFQIPKIKDQLLKIIPGTGKKAIFESKNPIEEAFCAGYFMNVARKTESGYRTIFGNIECNIHPLDGLFKQNASHVLYYELVCIRKEFMRYCLEIDPQILTIATSRNYM